MLAPADTGRQLQPETTAAAAGLRSELERISRSIFADPELAFEEHRARTLLTGWLSEQGFRIDPTLPGLETAFVARMGAVRAGSPRIALLAEYDALPGLGHGCGHNLIAAGAVVAAATVAAVMPDIAGELLVIGTPAEEGGGGKVLMLNRGIFNGLDAALMFHPADRNLPWRHARSSAHLRVTFHGRAAHAAKNPEDGANALAAMIQLYVAIDAMRQHLPSAAQIHGVIRNGGAAPNVVPDLTVADFLVRGARIEALAEHVERFRACAEGAAIATGTTVEVEETAPTYSERKNNHTMADRVSSYLVAQGIEMEPPAVNNPSGSSDIGNVSLVLPIIHPYLAVAPRGTPGHSVAFRERVCTDMAHECTAAMAAALSQTALDLFESPTFLASVRDEFSSSGPDLGA